MASELKIELSPQQQELILRGLRYVRSSVALEMATPTDEVIENRKRQYAEIAELEGLLSGNAETSPATV